MNTKSTYIRISALRLLKRTIPSFFFNSTLQLNGRGGFRKIGQPLAHN
jgi:hypothetical protein